MRNRIRQIRAELDITQEQLAERVGCTAGYISRIENGQRRLHGEYIGAIAKALGVAPGELFESAGGSADEEYANLKRDLTPEQLHNFLVLGRSMVGTTAGQAAPKVSRKPAS